MADSGNIFITESPLPVQKAKTPPSEYIRVTAPPMALAPPVLPMADTPSKLDDRVIKNTLSRSNGAVHVRETDQVSMNP